MAFAWHVLGHTFLVYVLEQLLSPPKVSPTIGLPLSHAVHVEVASDAGEELDGPQSNVLPDVQCGM